MNEKMAERLSDGCSRVRHRRCRQGLGAYGQDHPILRADRPDPRGATPEQRGSYRRQSSLQRNRRGAPHVHPPCPSLRSEPRRHPGAARRRGREGMCKRPARISRDFAASPERDRRAHPSPCGTAHRYRRADVIGTATQGGEVLMEHLRLYASGRVAVLVGRAVIR